MKGKTRVTVIQGYHSPHHGWEDESTYEGPDRQTEARRDIREYRRASPTSGYKIISRWEDNEEQTA